MGEFTFGYTSFTGTDYGINELNYRAYSFSGKKGRLKRMEV